MALKQPEELTCVVCGHKLGPYMKICDRCGSIQRPAEGAGLLLPPEEFAHCKRCGMPIPVGDELCAECAAIEEIEVDLTETGGRSRKATVAFLVASVCLIGVCIWGIAATSAPVVFIVVLCLVVTALVVFGIATLVARRKPKPKIEVYPRYKPEKTE